MIYKEKPEKGDCVKILEIKTFKYAHVFHLPLHYGMCMLKCSMHKHCYIRDTTIHVLNRSIVF